MLIADTDMPAPAIISLLGKIGPDASQATASFGAMTDWADILAEREA